VQQHAWDDVFGGGVWCMTALHDMTFTNDTDSWFDCRWTNDHSHGILGKGYKNAITNELFLYAHPLQPLRIIVTFCNRYASVSLYKATGNATFLHWADKELKWLLASGMINSDYLVNDGLDKYGRNNNGRRTRR
jgi:hypothetical protein